MSEDESDADNVEYCTLVFKCNLRTFDGNPFHVETPFGKAVAVGIGHAFDKLEDMEEAKAYIALSGYDR